MKLSPGDPAPLIQVEDAFGKTIDLSQAVGQKRWVVLWFYPKAKSQGCLAQGKHYADLYETFQKMGAEVYGVSADPASEQCSFIDKMALKGGMIPDRTGVVGRAFGVGGFLGFGLWFGMYNRDTILINPQGNIEQIWRNANPYKDAQTVLAYLQAKQSLAHT